MKLFLNYFLVKRPKESVLSKSKKYYDSFPKAPLNNEIQIHRRKLGFEDGYVECLKDLGIDHTIDGFTGKNN